MGLGTMSLNIENKFDTQAIIRFNISQVVANIIAWGVIAPLFDIIIYAEPANKVFLQGLVGGLANIVTTAIVFALHTQQQSQRQEA